MGPPERVSRVSTLMKRYTRFREGLRILAGIVINRPIIEQTR